MVPARRCNFSGEPMNIRESMRSAIADNSPTFLQNMFNGLLISSEQVNSFIEGRSTLPLKQIELLLTYLDFKLELRNGV
jgi:hypothetical protein